MRILCCWCVPNRDPGYNKRFKKRKDAFEFWRANATLHSKPSKVEINYKDVLDLADNCLAGESTVQEPYYEGSNENETNE